MRAGLIHIKTSADRRGDGQFQRDARAASGYRHYADDAVARLRFIRQAKDLGFSLAEIRELLTLKVTPGNSCAAVRARAEAKIADVEQRIALINSIACPSCEVEILDMHQPDVASKARQYRIGSVPAGVVNGTLADCCSGRGPDEKQLRAAGIGTSL